MLTFKNCFVTLMVLIFLIINCNCAFTIGAAPPNLVVVFTLKYLDPQTNKPVVHKTRSDKTDDPRTFEVPAGVYMVLEFKVWNIGGSLGGDGADVDIWMDWPYETRPKDLDDADVVCKPSDHLYDHVGGFYSLGEEGPAYCFHIRKTMKADLNYEGKEGKGIYNIIIWADRFDTLSEGSKDDNYLAVKIIIRPTVQLKKGPLTIQQPRILKP